MAITDMMMPTTMPVPSASAAGVDADFWRSVVLARPPPMPA